MPDIYDAPLKARLTLDDGGRVRGINHVDEFWASAEPTARQAAIAYLRQVADTLAVPADQLQFAHQPVTFLEPTSRDTEYRLHEEKPFFDATTEGFYQTHRNVPVWAAGLTVTVKHGPMRVVSAVNTSLDGLNAKLPTAEVIERWRSLFRQAAAERPPEGFGPADGPSKTESLVGDLLAGGVLQSRARRATNAERQQIRGARVLSGRFFVYRYRPEERLPRQEQPTPPPKPQEPGLTGDQAPQLAGIEPTLPLPPVDRRIRAGADYLVAELVFAYATPTWGDINWRALVELETSSILYLRALAASVNGLVFLHDPISESGNVMNGPSQTNTVLNPFRDDVTLPNLNAPSAGVQSLVGSRVALSEEESPTIAAPTEATGTDFDYPVRTNNFSAVNAYYHVDRFFALVESLGFPLATYFNGTTFPVPVDHRGLGSAINAHCNGTGTGIDHLCYALAHTGDLTNPIGIATDWRVHLHELGGHGILHDHVGGPNFGFSHSAGDSMAVILSDPESQAPDRFVLAPFVPAVPRRCDRGVAEWSVATVTVTSGGTGYTSLPTVTLSGGGGSGATAFVPSLGGIVGGAVVAVLVGNPGTGYTSAPSVTFSGGGGSGAAATSTIGTWTWGGGMDLGGYRSEEILATTLFRAYRSIGGDHSNVDRKRFAARYLTYLLLRTVGTLTPATNPTTSLAFLNSMIATDLLNWTSEGVFGGAYGKVLRWAFEKQGLFQVGSPPPSSVTTAGQPPAVDVYIDDGRAGEYPFQPVHWNTTTIWNRLAADGGTSHEEPDLGVTNYAYVKIKNRGTQTANNVIVRGYHTKPMAGLLWPNDFEAFTTAQLSAGTLGPNNTEEKTVGPFSWVPTLNAYGHDCMLMIVSATSDPSNIDNFTAGEVIPEWRLVPNDNNIGQRNVFPIPGGGGEDGLIAGLHGFPMWVGNPNPARAVIDLQVSLPKVLAERGWRLGFQGVREPRFALDSRAQRELRFDLRPGAPFDRADVEAATDRDIVITVLADAGVIGGMTYRLDPTLGRPRNPLDGKPPGRDAERCKVHAAKLLECLNLHGHKISKVRVKKVTIDVGMEGECCC
jgi:hypothetical protein